jgi:hypothetical protein
MWGEVMTGERARQIIDAAGDGTRLQFYECGICDCWHSLLWDGDCRDDANRFACDELDEALGAFNWDAVDMPS